jgi:hypothetical protein
MRHSEIRNHCGEPFSVRTGRNKDVDAPLSTVSRGNVVAVTLQSVSQRFDEQRVIVDKEQAKTGCWHLCCSGVD